MTEAERLESMLEDLDAAIAAAMAATGPDWSSNGRSVQQSAHLSNLLNQRAELRKQLIQAQGPFLVKSRGRV